VLKGAGAGAVDAATADGLDHRFDCTRSVPGDGEVTFRDVPAGLTFA
jgi:hypothetical protein